MNHSIKMPTRDGVIEAAGKLAAILPPTPLLPVEINGTRCWVKAENLQPIGAFKIRGAWHRLSSLTDAERAAGGGGLQRQPRPRGCMGRQAIGDRNDHRDAA